MIIQAEIIKKIKADYSSRKLERELSDHYSRNWETELNRRFAVSLLDAYDNCIFVISEKNIFESDELVKKEYMIYQYTIKGVFVKNLDPKVVGWDFFNNLKYIDNEINVKGTFGS